LARVLTTLTRSTFILIMACTATRLTIGFASKAAVASDDDESIVVRMVTIQRQASSGSAIGGEFSFAGCMLFTESGECCRQ
jgi:hypothetical protein